jgi:hypothetical protein
MVTWLNCNVDKAFMLKSIVKRNVLALESGKSASPVNQRQMTRLTQYVATSKTACWQQVGET